MDMDKYIDIENRLLGEAEKKATERAKDLPYHIFMQIKKDEEELLLLQWLDDGKVDDVITYIHYNCEFASRFMIWDVSHLLIEQKDIKRIHFFFNGLIPGRVQRYKDHHKAAKEYGAVDNIKTSCEAKSDAIYALERYWYALSVLDQTESANKAKQAIVQIFNDENEISL
jgi:hypothetical protein